MWAARTRQLQRAHVSVFDRLWSNLPYLRPMCTIIGDSLADYVDPEGGRGKPHPILEANDAAKCISSAWLTWDKMRSLRESHVDWQGD